jgi:hypothetical protein
LFGDVFLRSEDGWWYLDTIEGSLTRLWESRESMTGELDSDGGRDRYLLTGLAAAASPRGDLTLGPDDVYDLVHPPVLGGDLALDNISVCDFVVAVNVAGQVHDQARQPPAGTPVEVGVEAAAAPSAGR